MTSKFPELVETALNNLAQFRNRNSLKYTFKTHTRQIRDSISPNVSFLIVYLDFIPIVYFYTFGIKKHKNRSFWHVNLLFINT